jgi:RimJ/RimL family protein N-acetyltransferase
MNVKLAFFERSDFRQLIGWSGDESFLLQWAGWQFKCPLSVDQLEQYINDSNDLNTSGKLLYKCIEESTGNVIGHISLSSIERQNGSGRIARVLIGPTSERGKGIGESMIRAALRIGFEELHLHRISLGVFDFNKSAIRCYEKIGFSHEGLLRDACRYKDTFWNMIEMSMLVDEWSSMNKPY